MNQKVILVVEDQIRVIESVIAYLRQIGHYVVIVTNLHDLEFVTLPLLVEQKDTMLVALVDGSLREGVHTDEDGIRATQIIKKAFPNTFVVAISGQLEVHYGDARLLKPLGLKELQWVLKGV